MEQFTEFGPPFWDETTHLPPQNQEIKKYLLYSTKSSIFFVALDKEEDQVKIIKFIKLIEEKMLRIKDELETIHMAQHPNIIKIQDCFRYYEYMCIVIPYTPHLSLHQYLENEYPNGLPEELAANIFRQMLRAVEYLHSLSIWNRDIKLESFLVFDSENQTNANNKLNIVLSNFEYAKIFEAGLKGTQFIGTPEFMAPEMVNHTPYDETVDIWSLGVSLFALLTGRLPFPNYREHPHECLDHVSKGLLNYKFLEDKGISHSAISLIKSMCDIDPKQRVSATTALMSTWILENNVYTNSNEAEIESKIAEDFLNKEYSCV